MIQFNLKYSDVNSFSNGLAAVDNENEKYGFINTKGEEVIPCRYNYALSFSKGFAKVEIDGKWGIIDAMGKEIVPCRYYMIYPLSSEGLFMVEKWRERGYGFFNTKGEEVIPCKYENAKPFSEGVAAVKKDGKWGYVDMAGKDTF